MLVSSVYYWRARTEEAHLLSEDPKYREYYDWMEANGFVTAPLSALKRKLIGRLSGRGRGSAGVAEPMAQEPAE